MSTHNVPDAMQSSTNRAPTACAAAGDRLRYASGKRIPEAVSMCGAKTQIRPLGGVVLTTSSIGAGANGAFGGGAHATGSAP